MKKIERVEAIDSRAYRFIKATAPKRPNRATEVVRAKVLEHKRGGKSDTKQGRRSNGNRNGTGDPNRKENQKRQSYASRANGIFFGYILLPIDRTIDGGSVALMCHQSGYPRD